MNDLNNVYYLESGKPVPIDQLEALFLYEHGKAAAIYEGRTYQVIGDQLHKVNTNDNQLGLDI